MDATTTELLARLEIVESEVKELREQVEGVGVVFEMDMDVISPEWLLEVDEDNKH